MDETPTEIDLVFNELAKSLMNEQLNSKLVTSRVSRLKKFILKADRVYFPFLKNNIDDFLAEEEKIHQEIQENLNEDDDLSVQIEETVSQTEEAIEDTIKLVEQSRELRNGIETINKRINSYREIQRIKKELHEVQAKCHEVIEKQNQKDNIVVDED